MTTLKVLATGSKGNCYLLESDGKILILDAGIPVQDIRRGMNYDTRHVVLTFCSHVMHSDHSKGLGGLEVMGIPSFKPCLSEKEFDVIKHDGFVLKSFPLPHDGVENRGVYIQCPDGHKVLYMTDWQYSLYVFKEQRINTLLIECNYCESMVDPESEKYDHVLRGHASLSTVRGFIEANKTEELRDIVLCHLSKTSSDEDEIMRTITSVVDPDVNVCIARPGVTFKLTDWREL